MMKTLKRGIVTKATPLVLVCLFLLLGVQARDSANGAEAEESSQADSQKPAEGQTNPPAANQQKPSQEVPATAPAGATPSKDKEKEMGVPVRLHLDHADLNQVINIIGNELKLNYVVDPLVKGNATINTFGDLHREDLLPLLETLLNLNGAAIVKTGNLYHIVPGAKVKQLAVPIRSLGQPGEPAKGIPMETQIVPMRYVAAKDMQKILTFYLSDGGNLVVHEEGNILIITESTDNLKRLLELVNILDSDVFANDRVQLYPIQNNRSKSLIPDLENIFAAYGLSKKDSAVRFISIDRINAILAISSNPGSFAEVEKWLRKLDQPVINVGVKNYFFKIENGDARNIAAVLLEIYGKASAERASAAPPGTSGAPEEQKPVAKPIQGEIKIVPDLINNALVVQASPQDYEVIKETIQELDRVPRQALIDAKIYEVTLTGALSLGVSYFLQQRSTQPQLTTASFSPSTTPPGLNISTFSFIGQTRELIAFLNAQETRSRARILSSPTVIASDNKDARIQVGAEVPILTSQGVVPGGQVGGTSLFSNTIQNKSTGIILNVIPRINSSGLVTLKISQEVSVPVPPPAGSGIQSPSINIRSVNTELTVKDGETIAMGGIIQENKLLSKNRVPLLGDIPGLGLIFGTTSYNTTRTELIALITPHVIPDVDTAADATDDLKSKLKALKKDLKRLN